MIDISPIGDNLLNSSRRVWRSSSSSKYLRSNISYDGLLFSELDTRNSLQL